MRKHLTLTNFPIILSLLVVLLTLPAAVFLVQQEQELRGKAAIPETATLTLETPKKSYQVGETFKVDIRLDTGNRTIPTTGTDVILRYEEFPQLAITATPAAETQPIFIGPPVPTVVIEPVIITPGRVYDSYPVRNIDKETGTITISGAASALDKYFFGNGIFATIEFRAVRPGNVNLYFYWKSQTATDDTNVVGIVNGEPKERLLLQPSSLDLKIIPAPTLNPVSWKTNWVSLKADDFYIIADEEKYLANVGDVRVSSDPGSATYTTLEMTWQEHGKEMRLFMYFNANRQQWWSPEIRTYNGQERGDWIYYTGRFFESLLGRTFTGDVDLKSNPGQQYTGSIHFKNLRLQAFLIQPTPTPTPICKTGVNSFSVYNPCPDGFRNAKYICYDGASGILGGPTSCKSSATWREYAEKACRGRSSCPTPTPFPSPPIPTITPPPLTPTPTPPPISLNFSLVLEGRGACGFASDVSIYGSFSTDEISAFGPLGKTQTDITGRGSLALGREHLGRTYQLFARTPSHLRKKATSTITIHKGDNYVDFGNLIPGDLFIAPGENEQDNLINNFDVAELFQKWGPTGPATPSAAPPAPADFNCDGIVNTWDLKIVFENFGKSGDEPSAPEPRPSPIPTPFPLPTPTLTPQPRP